MSIFKGAAVAIITPMTETQEVNYEKLGELIEGRSPAEPTPSLSAEPPVRLRPCPMRSIWMPSNIPWKK